MKPHKSKSIPDSFAHALNGIRLTVARERNFKIQIAFAIVAAIVCIILPVDFFHTFMVMYAIFFVLCMELINTAVEAIVDLYCGKNISPLAKIAKDCSAGAVLLASVQAVLVAVMVARHILIY
ncbi:MAG: diacylglycerol kinase family protein [Defluviitaleaceae bacterium]|nr:diacylglycerol kinase family protein [Defluviitaleaceae bacterium]